MFVAQSFVFPFEFTKFVTHLFQVTSTVLEFRLHLATVLVDLELQLLDLSLLLHEVILSDFTDSGYFAQFGFVAGTPGFVLAALGLKLRGLPFVDLHLLEDFVSFLFEDIVEGFEFDRSFLGEGEIALKEVLFLFQTLFPFLGNGT
jgi:hypothetical protein